MDKLNGRITGAFFILAAITSIIGLILYEPALRDVSYLSHAAQQNNKILTGVFLELMLVCTAAGTAIMLYPYLKRYNESLGMGYFCFRLLEVVSILIGTISVLSILSLSRFYTGNVHTTAQMNFQILGQNLIDIHSWTFIIGPNFFLGINTFIYAYVFFKTNLVSKKIAVLGLIAAILIFIAAFLEMFGIIQQVSLVGGLFGLPIFVYEMMVAIWLIIKGFNTSYWNR